MKLSLSRPTARPLRAACASTMVARAESVLIANTKGGGHAFIGLHAANALLDAGHTVTILNDGDEVRGERGEEWFGGGHWGVWRRGRRQPPREGQKTPTRVSHGQVKKRRQPATQPSPHPSLPLVQAALQGALLPVRRPGVARCHRAVWQSCDTGCRAAGGRVV